MSDCFMEELGLDAAGGGGAGDTQASSSDTAAPPSIFSGDEEEAETPVMDEDMVGDVDRGDDDDDYDDEREGVVTRLAPAFPQGEDGGLSSQPSSSSPSQKLYQRVETVLQQAIQSNERKRQNLESELRKAENANDLIARANLITSNLYLFNQPGGAYTSKVRVVDWENGGIEVDLQIDTDKYGTAQDEAKDLYKTAKRLKRGMGTVSVRLEDNERALIALQKSQVSLERCLRRRRVAGGEEEVEIVVYDMELVRIVRDDLISSSKLTGINVIKLKGGDEEDAGADSTTKRRPSTTSRQQQQQQQHTCRRLTSPDGLTVLVGRNRRDNEYISFHAARGKDVWLHARGCPGAHVLVQLRRGDPHYQDGDIPDTSLQYAADLAAFYSDARTERKAVITAAQPKHIQKPRGSPPGTVKLRQELKSLVGHPQDAPEDLKLKREEGLAGSFGGGADESGSRSFGGKAKNRKKTLENVRLQAEKKRAEKRKMKNRSTRRNTSNSSGSDMNSGGED